MNQNVMRFLRREAELPPGVCPILGHLICDLRDSMPTDEERAEEIDEPLSDLLATSEAPGLEMSRRVALAEWLRDVAWPRWLAYADFRPGQDLDDEFAEAVAMNQGNGIGSINSFMRSSGVTAASCAAAKVRLGLTKNKSSLKARLAIAPVKVETASRVKDDAGAAVPEEISPQKIASRCFRAAFTQTLPADRVIEDLQESLLTLVKALLTPA